MAVQLYEVQMDSVEMLPTSRALSGELELREHEMLAFERQWWKYAGAKEQAVRELFGLSATRYYQILNALIEKRAAMEADPMLVKRLLRERVSRHRVRAARRFGIDAR
jgi:hypothetical protein